MIIRWLFLLLLPCCAHALNGDKDCENHFLYAQSAFREAKTCHERAYNPDWHKTLEYLEKSLELAEFTQRKFDEILHYHKKTGKGNKVAIAILLHRSPHFPNLNVYSQVTHHCYMLKAEIASLLQHEAYNQAISSYEIGVDKAQRAVTSLQEQGFPRSLKEISQVIKTFDEAAILYAEASSQCRNAYLSIDPHAREEDRSFLNQTIENFESSAALCQKDAAEWREKEANRTQALNSRSAALREEIALLETKGLMRQKWEAQKRLALILEELMTCDTELAMLQKLIATFQIETDAKRLTENLPFLSDAEFWQRERERKEWFFKNPSLYTHDLPWQLSHSLTTSPSSPWIGSSFEINLSLIPDFPESELNPQPLLDKFVEEMKKDPLALAQFVQNEIDFADPFLLRKEGVFQSSPIQQSPLGTFLAKQGSPWEQCELLVYLLQKAGYKALYAEGATSFLPKEFVEKMIQIHLPGEKEIGFNYPWVLLLHQDEWIPLFPWIKDTFLSEGDDLYSKMPKDYATADLWIKSYLCNDEKILKQIGPDGDDSAAILFVRFVEEELRKQGLSLQDVGTQRLLYKKQFASWEDFPRPSLKEKSFQTSSGLTHRPELFAHLQIEIFSKEHPEKKITLDPTSLSALNSQSLPISFSSQTETHHKLHFKDQTLELDPSDQTIEIKVIYQSKEKIFSIAKGTTASLCFHFGNTTPKITSKFREEFRQKDGEKERLNALLAYIGSAYFEKCSRAEQALGALHKQSPLMTFACGLIKLSPDLSQEPLKGDPILKFPQIDIHFFTPDSSFLGKQTHRRPFQILSCVDRSSNEHQVLKEVYQHPHAISTVKLLQLAHLENQKKSPDGTGTGFLTITNQSPFDSSKSQPHQAQWEIASAILQGEESDFSYAYITPDFVCSQDGDSIHPPSYQGIGTLIIHPEKGAALISDGAYILNGGFGSLLPNDFSKSLGAHQWELFPRYNSYTLQPNSSFPNEIIRYTGGYNPSFPSPFSSLPQGWGAAPAKPWTSAPKDWHPKGLGTTRAESFKSKPDNYKSDIRPALKTAWDVVDDPVDVVTGAYYIDEIDLSLPGPFPIELRRNYNNQNPILTPLGHGWKIGLNPTLIEEGDKLFAAEKDGTVIVYRLNPEKGRWEVRPDDNPELVNFNQQGIGSTANPFHAYIEKKEAFILYSSDGSTRIFENHLLQKWTDHKGSFLIFSYENDFLKRIENENGNFIGLNYNDENMLEEIYTKDGRHILYTYDSRRDLRSVLLPNNGTILYEYDHEHQIIRETKPHGRSLENIYKEGRVVEQRSPSGLEQRMAVTAKFTYTDTLTTVEDGTGAKTEYRIFQKQIYKITDPEGHLTFQSWFIDDHSWFDAETETLQSWDQPGASARSLKSTKDKRGLVTEYLYDAHGNPEKITLIGDDLTGKGDRSISKNLVYNENHLCIEEKVLNKTTLTTYDPQFPYLPQRIEQHLDQKLISYLHLTYTDGGQIKTEDHSGAIVTWEYDNRKFLFRKTQKSGSEDPDVVTQYKHNDQGQCIEKKTTDGIWRFKYDIMGNSYQAEVFDLSGNLLSTTHTGYDLNNEVIWQQGPDPLNTIYSDFNACGRIKAARQTLTRINRELKALEPAGIAYTLYDYNVRGDLIEETDPLGHTTTRTYDKLQRIKTETKHNATTSFTYEAGGEIETITSPGKGVTRRLYTTNGLLHKETFPDDTFNFYLYDYFGRPVLETQNGITWETTYDDATQTVIRTHPETQDKEIKQYDSRGNLIRFIDAEGSIWTKTYDSLNRIKTETDPDGHQTTWSYTDQTIITTLPSGETTFQSFEAGSLIETKSFQQNHLIAHTQFLNFPETSKEQKISGETTTTTWKNTLGQPVLIEQDTQTTIQHYNAGGQCITLIDGEGRVITQTHDPLGRLTQKELPDGAQIRYEYDADSNLIETHLPGDVVWKASYDLRGRKKTEEQQAEGKTAHQWQYIYEQGRLTKAIDPLHRTHTYIYDLHGRLVEEAVGKENRRLTYDRRGLLKSAIQGSAIIERTYDSCTRLESESIYLNSELLQYTRQIWEPATRSLEIGDHKRTFHFEAGRLKKISTREIELLYDHATNGALKKRTTPFHTTSIDYQNSSLPQEVDTTVFGHCYHESLRWTDSGKLASYTSQWPECSSSQTFDYTPRGYLKQTEQSAYEFDFGGPGRGVLTSTSNSHVPKEGLDPFGKILTEIIQNQSITSTYDALGQIESRQTADDEQRYEWDPWGRLISITSKNFVWQASYDAFGRRLQTTYAPLQEAPLITTSIYDPEEEFQEIGVQCGNQTFWKIYGESGLDAITDPTGESVTLIRDTMGNLTGIASSQEVTWSKQLPTPYGHSPSISKEFTLHSFAQAFAWQGRRADPTGLIWMGARYYDPLSTRFLSMDPVGYPVSLDLYAYANGDPINFTDPDGRFASYAYRTLKSTEISRESSFLNGDLNLFKFEDHTFFYDPSLSPEPMSFSSGIKTLKEKNIQLDRLLIFQSGIGNSKEDHFTSLKYLSQLAGGKPCASVWFPTFGFFPDYSILQGTIKSGMNASILHGVMLYRELNGYLGPKGSMMNIGHSFGGMNSYYATSRLPPDIRSRIDMRGVAPAMINQKRGYASVHNYVSSGSDVCKNLVWTKKERKEAIKSGLLTVLPKHPDAGWHDHTILSPTFKPKIKEELEKFYSR